MLSSFKNRLQAQTLDTFEQMSSKDCSCAFCAPHHEIPHDAERVHIAPRHPRGHAPPSLPSTRSIMQVLYPPSYLGVSSPFPDPPSYSQSNGREDRPPVPVDPLAENPSLTGVPSSHGALFRPTHQVEPNPPSQDVSDENEPLPAYSRFDERRPRFPSASDVLGPYPPYAAIRQATQ